MIKLRFLLLTILILSACANRGTPTGGEIDTDPPVVLKSSPENYTTNFKAEEIEIIFDEYIRLNNTQKELIISPPIDPQPLIMPMGSASKILSISEFDSLQENTTYSFHFGESIEDNNEGNAFPFYKYVLSTGSSIDSLSVTGIISDAFEIETPEFISVHLHDVDSTYNDSIIFKQKPKYIGVTDSLSQFNIENLKEGKYLLTALKEENTDYIYQSKKDKIAFKRDFITVPSDTAYYLKLFKQLPDSKFIRARQLAQGRIGFGYEGSPNDMNIKSLSKELDSFYLTTSKEPEKDTLNLWMSPRKIEVDSLLFQVSLSGKIDTVSVRIKNMEKDSLTFKAISNTLKLIILPIVVYFLARYFGLSQTEIVVAVIFASVPTATMSYTLAKQFGADDQLMRGILTTQVALSFLTIPTILAFIA